MKHKFIFITGGVMSGLGKGVITASIAKLLQLSNQNVSCIKIDPYLNYDAGTMNPITHGEVFVTKDGGECDMDIGNYERFLNKDIPRSHNITTAQIYSHVIESERQGKYLGACVQIIPHITDEIKNRIKKIANDEKLDVIVVECGGTIGDIESLPFLESLRQIRAEFGNTEVLFVHVTLIPSLEVVNEQKTKPTQHSVQELRKIGIQPDMIIGRCEKPLLEKTKKKIALFTNVNLEDVISCHDAKSIFNIPDILSKQGVTKSIFKKFNKTNIHNNKRWNEWYSIVNSLHGNNKIVKIAMIGKYVSLADSYVSVVHALKHSAASLQRNIAIDLIDSENININKLANFNGILIPGGFGTRGSKGIIKTANYAYKKNIPYLGICFGFQLAIVAFGLHYCKLDDANSTEICATTKNPVIDLLPEQNDVSKIGGSLRLGSNKIKIKKDTITYKIYKNNQIIKRHRHRYEFNKNYLDIYEKNGLIFSGESDNGRRIEIIEEPTRKFFIGVQFHPEFDSRPGFPENIINAFIHASML